MNTFMLDTSRWLWDYFLLATVLLAAVLVVNKIITQPARRMAIHWSAAAGLLLLALMCAVPGWSVVHMISAPTELPPVEVAEIEPIVAEPIADTAKWALAPTLKLPATINEFPATAIDTETPSPVSTPAEIPSVEASPIDYGFWSLTIAGIGAVFSLLWLTVGSWQVRRLRAQAQPAPPELTDLLAKLAHNEHAPDLGVAKKLPVAVAVGLRQPMVLLPSTFLELTSPETSPKKLQTVLAHELAHIRHRDLWLLALLRGLLLILWPHPLFWLWRRNVRLDQETLADAAASEVTNRTDYAEQLVDWARVATEARAPRLASSVGLWESPSQLKRRIAILLDEKLTVLRACSRRWRVGSMLGMTAIAAGLSLLTLSPAEPPLALAGNEPAIIDSHTKDSSQPVEEKTNNARAKLSGRIVLEDGSPATTKGWLYSNSRTKKTVSFSTEGQFTDSFECEVQAGTVVLSHFPDGYAPAWLAPLEVKPGEVREDLELVLKPGFSSVVRVSNEQDQPVSGATVIAHPEIHGSTNGPNFEQTTDDKGECLLEHLATTHYVLHITAPGYQPLQTAPLRVEADEILRPTMVRSQPGTGVVRFADGTPAPGTKLRCKYEIRANGQGVGYANKGKGFWGETLTTCDASGRFQLDQLRDGSSYLFVVEAVDGARAIIHNLEAGGEETQIVLPRRRDLVINVKGDMNALTKRNGKPFASVRQPVNFEPNPEHKTGELIGGDVTIEPTEQGGRAIFRGLAVDLDGPDVGKQQVVVTLGYDDSTKKIVDLNLTGGTVVEFDLNKSDKQETTKLGGWTLLATSPVADEEESLSQGSLVLSTPPADSDEANEAAKAKPKAKTTTQPEDAKIQLMRQYYQWLHKRIKPNTIIGICLDEYGRHLAGVPVQVFSRRLDGSENNSQPIFETKSDAQGMFTFSNVVDIAKEFPSGLPEEHFQGASAQIYTIQGRLAGRVPGIDSNTTFYLAKNGQVMVWVMSPAKTLRGRVTNDQGQPVAGAKVDVGYYASQGGSHGINSATTDALGEYVIDDLASENLSSLDQALFVTHPKYAMRRAKLTTIPGKLDVQLTPGSVIEGKVTFPPNELFNEKSPFTGGTAHLQRVIPPPKPGEKPGDYDYQVLKTPIDTRGHYRFQSLPAGKYHLTAGVDGWVTQGVENVEVERGKTTTAPDILLKHGGRVQVQLVDNKTGQPMRFDKPTKGYLNAQTRPQRASIFIFRENIVEFSTKGTAEIQVPTGQYTFHASIPKTDGSSDLTTVLPDSMDEWPTETVVDGEQLKVTISLKKQKTPTNADGELSFFIQSSPSDEASEKETPKEKTPTGSFIPATPPADNAKELPGESTNEDAVEYTSSKPELVYLGWQGGTDRDEKGDLPETILWDTQGKQLTPDEIQDVRNKVGSLSCHNPREGDLPPLLLVFEVLGELKQTVMSSVITAKKQRIGTGTTRIAVQNNMNLAVVAPLKSDLGAWPKKIDLEVRHPVELAQIIKTLHEIPDAKVHVAEGVTWFLDPNRAIEPDPQTGKPQQALNQTTAALQIRRGDLRSQLIYYDMRVYLKDRDKETTSVRDAYTTIIEPGGVRYELRVTDLFDSKASIERVDFLRRRYRTKQFLNVPVRVDLLPKVISSSTTKATDKPTLDNKYYR